MLIKMVRFITQQDNLNQFYKALSRTPGAINNRHYSNNREVEASPILVILHSMNLIYVVSVGL